MVIAEIGDDHVCATMPVDARTVQPHGRLHGGASVALAETLGSLATNLTLDPALAGYEHDRREATARIVLMNRQQGPDRVLDLARDRLASGGAFADVLPDDERRAIAASYKQTAGFDPDTLNRRASLSPGG